MSQLNRVTSALVLSAGLFAGAAHAGWTPFTFEVGFESGALAGQSAIGHLEVDCATTVCNGLVTAAGTASGQLLSFSITVGGETFTAADDSGFPDFPEFGFTNNMLTEIDYLADLGLPSLSISATAGSDGLLVGTGAFVDASGASSLIGSIQQIPEPATTLLLGTALLGGLALNRSTRARCA